MSKFCPNCGEELVDEAKFCRNCGKKLTDYEYHDNSQNEYQHHAPVVEKSHSLATVLGFVFAFLSPIIGIIIGIYLTTRKDNDDSPRNGKIIIAIGIIIEILSTVSSFSIFH